MRILLDSTCVGEWKYSLLFMAEQEKGIERMIQTFTYEDETRLFL